MPFLKKGIFYSILFFVIVWMFILGIFVGRGSIPVNFDTREFQKKLANIAKKYDGEHNNTGETEIHFYEDLQTPMHEAADIHEKYTIITRRIDKPAGDRNQKAVSESNETIPHKISQKNFKKTKQVTKLKKTESNQKKIVKDHSIPKIVPEKDNTNKYTIQIAAFKDLQSAFDKISSLKAQGYKAYRTIGIVQHETWHRVRSGHFSDIEFARKYLRKLKKDSINGIIIKQDL